MTNIINKFAATLPDNLQKMINDTIAGIGDSVAAYVNDFQTPSIGNAGNIVSNIAEGFLMVISNNSFSILFYSGEEHLSCRTEEENAGICYKLLAFNL